MAETNLLNLPLVRVAIVTGNNEDWLDGLAFRDAAGAPVDLSGIAFASMLRLRADDAVARVLASTETSWDGLARMGTLAVGGTGNGTLAWTVPVAVMRAVPPGTYQLDVIAAVQARRNRIVTGSVRVVHGITR